MTTHFSSVVLLVPFSAHSVRIDGLFSVESERGCSAKMLTCKVVTVMTNEIINEKNSFHINTIFQFLCTCSARKISYAALLNLNLWVFFT